MQDLTASLFQEAHRMVQEANVKRASAEKYLAESNMKIDGLETEVAALKTLVLTSTPSQPNRHLHPQLSAMDNKTNGSNQSKSNGQVANNSLLQGYVSNFTTYFVYSICYVKRQANTCIITGNLFSTYKYFIVEISKMETTNLRWVAFPHSHL